MIRESERLVLALVSELLRENQQGNGVEFSRTYEMPPNNVTIKIDLQKGSFSEVKK